MKKEILDRLVKEHQERRRRWISAAHTVAELAKYSPARTIVKFLKKHSIAGMVHLDSEPGFGFIRCQKSRVKNPIIFVVPNQGQRSSSIKGTYGSFISSINVLTIPNEPLSSFTRGMITLHEGQHAFWFRNKGCKAQKNANQEVKDLWHVIDEYYAQEIENEVLFRIGGERFQKIISEASRVCAREVRTMPDGSIILPPPQDFLKEFTEIFGRSLSDRENRLRTTWIDRATVNRYIDCLYPDDPEAAFETKVSAVAAQITNKGEVF